MLGGKFVALLGKPEASTDSRFGPVPQAPVLWARLCDTNCDRRLAFIVVHPSGNFLNHYLLEQLERRGVACLGGDGSVYKQCKAWQPTRAGPSAASHYFFLAQIVVGFNAPGPSRPFLSRRIGTVQRMCPRFTTFSHRHSPKSSHEFLPVMPQSVTLLPLHTTREFPLSNETALLKPFS
jgi:hypothetical protein